MSRASVSIAALSGAVVALALVAQATDFGTGFVAFALLLLPEVFFLGIVTIARLGQINWEDAVWTQGRTGSGMPTWSSRRSWSRTS